MKDMGNGCVSVYLAIALAEHDSVAADIDTILKYTGMKSVRNVRECLAELKKNQLIYVIKGLRSKGIPNTYKPSKFSLDKGFLSVEYLVLKDYLTLFSSELTLLLTLRRICAHQADVIINQTNLGNAIGCTRNNVGKLMQKLELRGYISIQRKYMDKVKFECLVDVLK